MIQVYKKLFGYVPEKRHYIILTLLFAAAAVACQTAGYYVMSRFLSALLIDGDMAGARSYAFEIAGLLAASSILYFLALSASHLFAFRLETKLRKFGIRGLQHAGFRFFDMNPSGQIRKRIDDNAAQTHMAVAHLLPDNAGALCMPVLLLLVGFGVSLRVGLVLVALLAVSVLLMWLMMGNQDFMKEYKASLERIGAETVEYVRGMQVIKIFGVDIRNLKALNHSIKTYARYAYDYSRSCRRPYVVFQLLFFGLAAIVTPPAVFLLGGGGDARLQTVEMIMLFFLGGVLFAYMMKVMYLSVDIFNARDAVDRLEQLYEAMHRDCPDFGTETDFGDGDIEFDRVSFSYEPGKPVFTQLSFRLSAGRSYALVGGSGSGKSTIVKLLSGFYQVDSGEIRIGGKALQAYSSRALTSRIAFVFQDAKLFKRTIYENVALANPEAGRGQVMEAMRLAGCDSIIAKFKDGENTVIGSAGVYLSGGEKQRIAIARAILKDAELVIFDEASAAVDADNEHELQKAFANLMKGKTVIMIAHRLSSIRLADEILVLKDGQLCERGTDAELMSRASLYRHYQTLYQQANEWRVVNERVV